MPAMRLKARRHPILWTRRTRGVVAAMFPTVPMEKMIPERVAKLAGPNQVVRSLNVPIRLQAMPTPIRTRPNIPTDNESAHAKIRAPATATRERTVIVRLGPTLLSNKIPIGIWVRAKA